MTDLETQIRHYAAGLDHHEPIAPEEVRRGVRARPRTGRRTYLVAAAVLVLVILGAAALALSSGGTEQPAPPVGTTAIPRDLTRIGQIDDGQPVAMATSDGVVVLVGYGAWWSVDGATWEEATVEGLGLGELVHPGDISDVIATNDGFLAVGVGDDRQPAVWQSSDGRTWQRVADGDLEEPGRLVPATVSTPYGSISAVTRTPSGLVAVGQAFDGTFVGDTLVTPDPFVPVVWTSTDGSDWLRAASLPSDATTLADVTETSAGTLVLGTDGTHGVVWRRDGDTWSTLGDIDGEAQALAQVGDQFVAAGVRRGDRQSTATIWTSSDGRTWEVAHEESPTTLATFTTLADDGPALLALGYSGTYETESGPLALASTDGLTWEPLPSVESPGMECSSTAGDQPSCVGSSAHPTSAVVHRGALLLAAQEQLAEPDPRFGTIYRLRAAIYRAEDRSDTGGAATPLDPG